MDWLTKQNGELIALMIEAERAGDPHGAGLVAILTVDQKLPYKQNILASRIAVVVVRARRTDVDSLLPLLPQVFAALATI
jgi:hypothetical protein